MQPCGERGTASVGNKAEVYTVESLLFILVILSYIYMCM